MNKIITNITIGNWYLVRGKPTKITPANVVWAFRDGCSPMPLTDEILKKYGFRREGGARNNYIAYDNLKIEELDYYLNSRIYRSQYYEFVRLLKTARSLIEKECQQEVNFINMLCGEIITKSLCPKDGFTHDGIASTALKTVKDSLKWKRPISSKERETYYLVRRTLFSETFRKKYFK